MSTVRYVAHHNGNRPGDVVNVPDDEAPALLWGGVAVEVDGHPCQQCPYVAKSAQGLSSHERTHDDG